MASFTMILEEVTDANLTATVEVEYTRNGGCNGDWYTPCENPFAEDVRATEVMEVNDETGNPVALTEPLKNAILAYVNTHRVDILNDSADEQLEE